MVCVSATFFAGEVSVKVGVTELGLSQPADHHYIICGVQAARSGRATITCTKLLTGGKLSENVFVRKFMFKNAIFAAKTP